MNPLASPLFAYRAPQGLASPAHGPAGLATVLGAGAAPADEHRLLRAEVEPQARGLSVQAHAERVLAALRPAG